MQPDERTRILIIAGEASGDLHGENLVSALKADKAKLQFSGMGGARMRRAGVETFFDIERTGMMGLFEVFGNIGHHLSIYQKLKSEIKSQCYNAIILIDYPTINLGLAKHAKRAGCPVYYFISPQIWAWRKGRIRKIRRRVKKMFVILPFEEKLYHDAGVDAQFVGHPFIELVKPTMSSEEACQNFGLPAGCPVVGLMPGSRMNEIDALLEVMLASAQMIRNSIPDCQFILPLADTIEPEFIKSFLGKNSLDVKVIIGRNYDVMNVSDCLIVASGSVTLEAAILGRPMVIVYKLHSLTYQLARWLVKVDNFGLVNIVACERLVPELLQDEVVPERIAYETISYLKNPEHAQRTRDRLLAVSKTLGEPGVAKRTARAILDDLGL